MSLDPSIIRGYQGRKAKILTYLGYECLPFIAELVIMGKTGNQIAEEINNHYCDGRKQFTNDDVYRLKRGRIFVNFFKKRKEQLEKQLVFSDWKAESEIKKFYEELTDSIDLETIKDEHKAELKMKLLTLMIDLKKNVEVRDEKNALGKFLTDMKKEIQKTPVKAIAKENEI